MHSHRHCCISCSCGYIAPQPPTAVRYLPRQTSRCSPRACSHVAPPTVRCLPHDSYLAHHATYHPLLASCLTLLAPCAIPFTAPGSELCWAALRAHPPHSPLLPPHWAALCARSPLLLLHRAASSVEPCLLGYKAIAESTVR